jgi:hypothetical protein
MDTRENSTLLCLIIHSCSQIGLSEEIIDVPPYPIDDPRHVRIG